MVEMAPGKGEFGSVYALGRGAVGKMLHGQGVEIRRDTPFNHLKEEARLFKVYYDSADDMNLEKLRVPRPFAVFRNGGDIVQHSLLGGEAERNWLWSHRSTSTFSTGVICMEQIFGLGPDELCRLRKVYYPNDTRWSDVMSCCKPWDLKLGLTDLPPADVFFDKPCVLAREAEHELNLDVTAISADLGRLAGTVRQDHGFIMNDVQLVLGKSRLQEPFLMAFVLDFAFAGTPGTGAGPCYGDPGFPFSSEGLWNAFVQGFTSKCSSIPPPVRPELIRCNYGPPPPRPMFVPPRPVPLARPPAPRPRPIFFVPK